MTSQKIPTLYRSNIQAVVTELKKLKLCTEQIEVLKRTPFWLLIDNILNGNVSLGNCRKHDANVTEIIRCFNKEDSSFIIGDQKMKIRQNDIRLIFGIQDGKIKIHTGPTTKSTSKFVIRCFPYVKRLTKTIISKKLEEVAAKSADCDIEDVARLATLYILVSLFIPTKSLTIGWAYTIYVENLDTISTFNWSNNILEALISSLNTNKDGHSGCVLLLPYWLCEHTTIVQPISTDAFPRFLKWDLRDLRKCLQKRQLESLNNKYIVREKLQYTEVEKILLQRVLLLEYNNEEQITNEEALQNFANVVIENVIMELKDSTPHAATEDEMYIDDGIPATVEEIVEDNTKMARKIEELEKLVVELNNKINEQQTSNITVQQNLQAELDANRVQVDSLKKELKGRDDTLAKYFVECEKLKTEIEEWKGEIRNLKEANRIMHENNKEAKVDEQAQQQEKGKKRTIKGQIKTTNAGSMTLNAESDTEGSILPTSKI